MKVGVVGAGLMGRMLAWELARRSVNVTLFDRDSIALTDNTRQNGSAAAYTAAGMITPYSEADVIEAPILNLGLRSLALWPHLVEALAQDVDFHQTGSLIVAHASDQVDLQHFYQKTVANGAPASSLSWCEGKQLVEVEAELKGFSKAIHIPGESWLNPVLLLNALLSKALELGVVIKGNTQVDSVEPHRIVSEAGCEEFDCVIDCRGMGAKPNWQSLRGVRGEVLWLHAPDVELNTLVRLIHPRHCIYIVPRAGQHYVIGATQIESDDRGPITVRSTMELLSAAYSVNKGFADASIIETRVNCRPAFSDNLPKIECEKGLIRVNGLFRHGFLTAPALVEDVLASGLTSTEKALEKRVV